MKLIFYLISTLSTNLYETIVGIITDPYKGFFASFGGLSAFSAPSYIAEVSGNQTPVFIMNLQTIGLTVTIILGILSSIKVLWDLLDKTLTKFNKKTKKE